MSCAPGLAGDPERRRAPLGRRLALVVAIAGGCVGRARPLPSFERPPLLPAVAWRAPAPEVRVLSSGLRVVLLDQPGLRLHHLVAIVQAGSALDGSRPGLAATTASLLIDGGAGVRGSDELPAAFEALGQSPAVHVDGDAATFALATAPSRLATALALLSDVLLRPRFEEAAWRRERERRLAEIDSEDDEPAEVADRVLARVLYGPHPYGSPVNGTAASVAALSAADLRAFFAAHYGPRTTTLVLVGDLDAGHRDRRRAPGDGLAHLVESVFAAWSPDPSPRPPPPPPPLPPLEPGRQPGPRRVLVDRPGAPQSEVRVAIAGVPRGAEAYPGLALAATALGGSFTSRLNLSLRERSGFTYDVTAALGAARGPAPLAVRTAVRTDATADSVGTIERELLALSQPLPAAELAKARAQLRGLLIDGFGDGRGASSLLAQVLAHDAPADAWSRWLDQLAGRDPPRVAAEVASLLGSARLTVVVVGDRAQVEPGLRALGPLELVDDDGQPLPAGDPPPRLPARAPRDGGRAVP